MACKKQNEMKEKTAMQTAIQQLEKQREHLKELDSLGVLLRNEFTHKSNQISTIQLMLSRLLPDEKNQIVEAYFKAQQDVVLIVCDAIPNDFEETKKGLLETANGDDLEDAEHYYSDKFESPSI